MQRIAPVDVTTPHVSVRDLVVKYRTGPETEKTALDAVSFDLRRGETLGIVGESGCGKSTLARALLGLARPGARFADGQIMVNGQDVLRLTGSALRQYRGQGAAMVPQNPQSSLTAHMTVGAQLAELARRHGLSRAAARTRALDLMEATGLPTPAQLFDRYPHELSGGQRQRIVIAAALSGQPGLIVLDEPTTALDKTIEAQVLALVARLQQDLGITLVYVSHDLNVVARMCSRVLVMRDGRVIEDGAVDQVFDRPATAYASDLIRAIPRLECHRPAPPALPPVLEVADLCFGYGGSRQGWRMFARKAPTPVLQDIACTLAPGQTLGVVGESGSGKSTLALLIAGALSGTEGQIAFRGTPMSGPVTARSPDLRRRVQMIFQDPLSSLNPRQTVEEIVSRPLCLFLGLTRAAARAKILPLFAELELSPELLGRFPRQLSGGQQQRVAIARAFVCDPDVVLCDEITSALDVTVQAQVLDLMERLQRDRGTSYLFISHDLPVVARMSDTVLVLREGMVMDLAPTAKLLNGQGSDYANALIAAFNNNARKLKT